ncbi:winged helix DNA-binding domain-containing protein [Kiloniella laminariae]|uniref:Winged helix DNA-binding domain-containing protein n=1 Tax=Kiloniella laminariae TaxID=454162 RepID=A0ABT4LL61_9PROT|nr:crosslink repair DNA glycosylase YcaQ family protein [Kiloniella laminariae]MCZ4280707.1 winged helix DNA-binding domain-containing protein [Kiloniella laminariae]
MLFQITNSQARRLFMSRQGLCDNPAFKQSRVALLELIERMGFVQVDSINTVERAHHMILFSRNQTYRKENLNGLLEQDRTLFEHWTHDASVIPARFFPYWRHRFARNEAALLERWRKWRREGFEESFASVLDHIRAEGAVLSRDLLALEGGNKKPKGSQGWWDWHPSKTALEFLWRTGALSVDRREGFQKVYDLTERVLPASVTGKSVHESEFIDWSCRSALDRLGYATAGELAAFWDGISPAEAKSWCLSHLGKDLVEVEVAAADGSRPRRVFAYGDIEQQLEELAPAPGRVRVLSPFDPLIRDRKRMERLFDYHYRIEVFVPEAKRQYGYYVFPLLEGEKLIGRIDMKRQDGVLVVKGLWLEPKIKCSAGRQQAIEAELERIRRFTGQESVVFENGYLKTPS